MSRSVVLTSEDAAVIQRALYSAKFALEQDVDGREKEEAIRKINEALDKMQEAQ